MIKKLLFIFLLQLSLVSCVCNQTKNRLIASRDSIANHTDKFITFKGLELKHGIQMADALKALEAKGFKRSEQFDYKKRKDHIYSLRGTFYKYRDCNITIYPTKNDKDIFGAISIYLPYRYSFKEMKKDYDYMRHVYGNRYHMVSATVSFDDKCIDENMLDSVKPKNFSYDHAYLMTEFHISDDKLGELSGLIRLNTVYITPQNKDVYYVVITYSTYVNNLEQIKARHGL